MPTTNSLLINLPGSQGAQYLTVSTGFQLFDSAIAGQATLTAWTGTYLLANSEFLNAVLVIPALTAATTLEVAPTSTVRSKTWLIDNTAGGYPVTVQVQSQSSPPVVPAGAIALVRCNGVAVSILTLYGVPVYRDLEAFFPGAPGASQVVMAAVLTTAWTLPAALAGSQAAALTPAGADAPFTVAKNGTSLGTITFHSTGAPSFAATTATSFAAGDVLTVTGPSSPDTDLAGLILALRGSLS